MSQQVFNKAVVNRHLLDLLKELHLKSTQVVSWYAHPAEVRGPFGRWFEVAEISPEYQQHCGSREDDAAFAAAAMNSLPALVAKIEELQEKCDRLEMSAQMDTILRER